ncbi:hypothetical protein Bca52824_021590 [Brassica carinata]|uniref:Uncharacterized protein n=1 Tax=Brassica carinata TaxID=52824 RepID=A0A8X7VF10_BRACI|nr:hypothetical protein Bca52824_021590 [Brassica carinata]
MAPSWYSQYGTFKNGLVQPVNDTGRFTPLNIGEKSSSAGSSAADGSHDVHSPKQMPGSAPGAEIPSSESLLYGATDKLVKVDKPKKRKTATSGLLSWNKQVMHGSQRLKTLSEAEVDLAKQLIDLLKRLPERTKTEKISAQYISKAAEDFIIRTLKLETDFAGQEKGTAIADLRVEAEDLEKFAVINRFARFHPSLSSSMDRTVSPVRLPERTKTEKISAQYISKAAEDFIIRTLKLETDFAGQEKGTAIADLRVEAEDLEKFAVINRFARFHPSLSSSMDRTVSPVRLNSQRYVTIAPMPRNIPDTELVGRNH